MKLPPLTRAQVRRVDQVAIAEYAIPGIILMENAGRGAAEVIDRVAKEGLVAILCGAGNNAGDGYVIARHLQLKGSPVRIVSLVDHDRLSGDAGINAAIAKNARLEIRHAQTADEIEQSIADAVTLVDALLGTGAKGPPRGLFAEAVRVANAHRGLRIAIDLPTGLDCDSGFAHEPTFRADHTVTFVARKVGFDHDQAGTFVGEVWEVGIGVPQRLLEEILEW